MTLNPIFRDGLVLQAGKPVRIFGTGKGTVSASLAGAKGEIVSESDGAWLLELPPMSYGGPYELTVSLDGAVTVLHDVMVGEVLLLGGQSNMGFTLGDSRTDKACYPANDHVRHYFIDRMEPSKTANAEGWVACTPEVAPSWSAIGYFAGHLLAEKRGCAVGLISCNQGASSIQTWLPLGALAAPELNVPDPLKHRDHFVPSFVWNRTSVLYNYMLATFAPYSVGNVVWYQGESNTTPAEAAVYGRFLELLVENWRSLFRDEALPFEIIQIADYDLRDDEGWHAVQDAQCAAAAKIDGAKLIVSRDVCESGEIHPPTKSRLCARIVDALEFAIRRE